MDQLEIDGRATSDFEVADHTVTTKWEFQILQSLVNKAPPSPQPNSPHNQ